MHTSLSKKLLAGLLSLVMVLSLVAPSMGTQAASKYSLTDKKSVKSDVTYKYQLKGVSKNQYVKVTRNVSGETVKYNKKAVSKTTKINGTGKTLNLYVTYGEKAENYTGKFTVKVYSKKTNKVAKTLVEKVTVKVSEKEAVTSVAINNTTPKVGDTITATVEPSNATNVSFAWYVLNSATEEVAADATPVSTTASYTTVAADAGKYVKVNVQGDNGSSASAVTDAVKADEGEKIAIASAKQTGAAKIEVSFNKAIATTDYDITLAKGTAKQEITVTLGEDNMSATLTAGVGLSSGDYTVTITKKADAKENASSTVTCEKAELKKIAFLGKELILTTSAMNSASVVIKGYNQFEEELSLSGSLKPYTSKGTATYDQKTSKIRIAAGASTLFNVGEQITVTAVYTSGSTVLQVAEPLTVSNVATLTKFELGDLATTKKELKDKKVTLDNFKTNTYYLPVKVAEDQYGNKLTAKDLDDMMIKPNEPAATAGNIYITPNSDTGSYAYVTGFEKLDDGTTAMKLALGSIAKPGKAIFSVTGVSGYSGTHEIEIEDNSYIAKLSVSAPNLYSTVASTLDVSAVDQYGNTLNLYDYVTAAMVTASPYTSTTGPATFNFNDKNNLTGGNSSIQIPKDASLTVSRDTSKKTVTFKYTPAARTAASDDVITLQSATPAVENLTWNVDVKPSPAAIKALGGAVKTTLAQGATTTFSDTTVRILDNNNALIDYANPTAIARVNFTTNAAPGVVGDGKYYVVVSESSALVDLTNDGGSPSTVTLNALASAGSAKVRFELVYNGTVAAPTGSRTSLDEKEYTFNVSTGAFTSYKAKIAAGDSLLYVNKDSADTTGFSVVGVDANGAELATTNYTVTVDSDLKINGKKVSGAVAGIGSKGTAVATIWAPVYDAASGTTSTQAVATVDVPYDVAAPVAQSVSTWNNTKLAASTETNFTVTSFAVNADGSVTLVAGNTYILSIDDQYGLPMANTKWAIDGSDVPTVATDWTNAVLTATSAKVNGSWTISGTTVTPTVAATSASVSAKQVGGNIIATVGATTAGTVGLVTAADYGTWLANKSAAATMAVSTSVTAGSKNYTLAAPAGNTVYYVVYQSTDKVENAATKITTAAPEASLVGTGAGSSNVKTTATATNSAFTGTDDAVVITAANKVLDQYAVAFTEGTADATGVKVYSDAACTTEITGLTIAITDTAGTLTATATGIQTSGESETPSTVYFKYLGCVYTWTVTKSL